MAQITILAKPGRLRGLGRKLSDALALCTILILAGMVVAFVLVVVALPFLLVVTLFKICISVLLGIPPW